VLRKKIHPHLLLIIPLVCLVCCTTSGRKRELAYGHFKIGVTMLNQQKLEPALEQLQKAHELDPKDPMILNHLGLAYFFLKEYNLAILNLNKAVSLKPDFTEAHNNLGRAYIEVKNFNQARKHLSTAAQDLTYISKDKVWLNLGLSYFHENQYEKSLNYFVKSISYNRDNCLAYNYYGRSLLETEDYKKAVTALDQAIYHCRKRGLDEPHYYGAISLYRLGYKSKALARLKEGRKLFPEGENKTRIDDMIKILRVTDN
jgi:type IV pilus assembly protein PilF